MGQTNDQTSLIWKSGRRILHRGFSLVEVVLAIGIISFAILGISSLFSVGLQGSRESSEDTNLALMTQYVNTWSRAQTFGNLAAPTNQASANPPPALYFTAAGEVARDSNGDALKAATADAHYACIITSQTSSFSPNLISLQYRFEWPLVAPANARQQRVIVTNRANAE